MRWPRTCSTLLPLGWETDLKGGGGNFDEANGIRRQNANERQKAIVLKILKAYSVLEDNHDAVF